MKKLGFKTNFNVFRLPERLASRIIVLKQFHQGMKKYYLKLILIKCGQRKDSQLERIRLEIPIHQKKLLTSSYKLPQS